MDATKRNRVLAVRNLRSVENNNSAIVLDRVADPWKIQKQADCLLAPPLLPDKNTPVMIEALRDFEFLDWINQVDVEGNDKVKEIEHQPTLPARQAPLRSPALEGQVAVSSPLSTLQPSENEGVIAPVPTRMAPYSLSSAEQQAQSQQATFFPAFAQAIEDRQATLVPPQIKLPRLQGLAPPQQPTFRTFAGTPGQERQFPYFAAAVESRHGQVVGDPTRFALPNNQNEFKVLENDQGRPEQALNNGDYDKPTSALLPTVEGSEPGNSPLDPVAVRTPLPGAGTRQFYRSPYASVAKQNRAQTPDPMEQDNLTLVPKLASLPLQPLQPESLYVRRTRVRTMPSTFTFTDPASLNASCELHKEVRSDTIVRSDIVAVTGQANVLASRSGSDGPNVSKEVDNFRELGSKYLEWKFHPLNDGSMPEPPECAQLADEIKEWLVQGVTKARYETDSKELSRKSKHEVNANFPSGGQSTKEWNNNSPPSLGYNALDSIITPEQERSEFVPGYSMGLDGFSHGVAQNDHSIDNLLVIHHSISPTPSELWPDKDTLLMSQGDMEKEIEGFDFDKKPAENIRHPVITKAGKGSFITDKFKLHPRSLVRACPDSGNSPTAMVDDGPPAKRMRLTPEANTDSPMDLDSSPSPEIPSQKFIRIVATPDTDARKDVTDLVFRNSSFNTFGGANTELMIADDDEVSLVPVSPINSIALSRTATPNSSSTFTKNVTPSRSTNPKSLTKRKTTKNVFAVVEARRILPKESGLSPGSIDSQAPSGSSWSFGDTSSLTRNRDFRIATQKSTIKSGPREGNKQNFEPRQFTPLKSTYSPQPPPSQEQVPKTVRQPWGYPGNIAVVVPCPSTSMQTSQTNSRGNSNGKSGFHGFSQTMGNFGNHHGSLRPQPEIPFANGSRRDGFSQRGRANHQANYPMSNHRNQNPTTMSARQSMNQMTTTSRRFASMESPQNYAFHEQCVQTPTPLRLRTNSIYSSHSSLNEYTFNTLPRKPDSRNAPISPSDIDDSPLKLNFTPSFKKATREVVSTIFPTAELRANAAAKLDNAITNKEEFKQVVAVAQFDSKDLGMRVSAPAGGKLRGLMKSLFPSVNWAASMS